MTVLPPIPDGDELYAHLLELHGGLPERIDADDDWALANWHRQAEHVEHTHETKRRLRAVPTASDPDFCGRCGDVRRHAKWCPRLREAS